LFQLPFENWHKKVRFFLFPQANNFHLLTIGLFYQAITTVTIKIIISCNKKNILKARALYFMSVFVGW